MRSTPRPSSGHKPFQPAIGFPFDGEDAVILEARTRGLLARAVTGFVAAAVAITGGYGLTTGRFVPLQVTWAVAGPMVGAIMAYYFGWQRRETA